MFWLLTGQFKQISSLESEYKTQSFEQRREQRLEHIFPLLQALNAEIERVSYRIAPSSPIGRAIYYFHDQWSGMEEILKDGRYERDNNLIEDKIRLSVCSSGSLSTNNRITDNLL
jgi:hypothetical protein